jgi:hypothetical protein
MRLSFRDGNFPLKRLPLRVTTFLTLILFTCLFAHAGRESSSACLPQAHYLGIADFWTLEHPLAEMRQVM